MYLCVACLSLLTHQLCEQSVHHNLMSWPAHAGDTLGHMFLFQSQTAVPVVLNIQFNFNFSIFITAPDVFTCTSHQSHYFMAI